MRLKLYEFDEIVKVFDFTNDNTGILNTKAYMNNLPIFHKTFLTMEDACKLGAEILRLRKRIEVLENEFIRKERTRKSK